jgi:hypothetical protein
MASDLQQNKLYHQTEPQSIQSSYTSQNQVDFLISCGTGRSLLMNSVRIVGDLQINKANGDRVDGGVGFNRNVGAHAFFSNMTTSFAGGSGSNSVGGQIENLQNYPRWVAMGAVASLNELDMLNASNQCELRAVNNLVGVDYAEGITPDITTGTAVTADVDFSIKPECCLNRMNGNHLAFNKTGIITLQSALARDSDALFGAQQLATSTYQLTNLRCLFQSVPDSLTPAPTNMLIEYPIKSNILSGTATLSTNVPAVCQGVSMNFILTNHESVPVFDSYRLENPSQLQSVSYIMNDKTNSLITYELTDFTEILERFVSSMYNTGRNQVSLDKFRSNNSFCCGLDFDGDIDLSGNRFTFQIASGIGSAYPMNVFQYFHSQISV